MSLHLCYRLTLPGATSAGEVRTLVQSLRDFAETLRFDAVLGPTEYTVDELIELDDDDIVKIIASTLCADPPDFYGVGEGGACAFAFVAIPGADCEPAVLGFLAPGARSDVGGRDDDLCPGEWFWSGACNTYFASRVSDAHFINCHAGLVRLLDHAATLGIAVQVDDETGFWEHRSAEAALKIVRDVDRIIDRLAQEDAHRWEERHRIGHPDHVDAWELDAVDEQPDD